VNNVLVVDSDQIMLKTLVGLLKNQSGFINIFEATSNKNALELLKKTPVDLVITSIRLPTADGFNLVAKLTRGYPSIKVIIMTEDAHPLLRASIKRIPSAIHLDQSDDIGMLTKRVFTELQIDYGRCSWHQSLIIPPDDGTGKLHLYPEGNLQGADWLPLAEKR